MEVDLNRKDVDVKSVAEKALKDEKMLLELLEGILSKEDVIRYNSHKVLYQISEKSPETLYHEWNYFESLLKSKNAYQRSIAVQVLANLTRADIENKFEEIFEEYYNMLNDSVIIARNIVVHSGRIVKAKPELQGKITDILLNINGTNQKHKGLVKGDAIEAFDQYFEEAKNKEMILKFVREQVNCESPRTRKIAKQFLLKWEK